MMNVWNARNLAISGFAPRFSAVRVKQRKKGPQHWTAMVFAVHTLRPPILGLAHHTGSIRDPNKDVT